MMYEEFLKKAGLTEQDVSQYQYARIERVYMCYERFAGKDELVKFYREYGMDGIEALYESIAKLDERTERKRVLEQCIAEKQAALDKLVEEARKLALQYGIDLQCL